MITLGEIVRQYGAAYRAQYGEQMLPSQQAALQAIEQCRTEALGGHVYSCPACGTTRYSYHSCRNRHCPICQHDSAQRWLARQQDLLLPVAYFLVTFTLPAELRAVAYRHQRMLYNLLFRASAAALMELARDPRFLGAQIGLVGVLQRKDARLALAPAPALPGTWRRSGRGWAHLAHSQSRLSRPHQATCSAVSGQTASGAAPDRPVEREPGSSLAARLGGRLPECRERTSGGTLSGAVHLSGRHQQ
jgi:hypothetical protein